MEIDFSIYTSFSTCPAWWRSFVESTCVGLSVLQSEPRSKVLEKELARYNCKMIDNDDKDVDMLIFETEEDFLAFKLRWE